MKSRDEEMLELRNPIKLKRQKVSVYTNDIHVIIDKYDISK